MFCAETPEFWSERGWGGKERLLETLDGPIGRRGGEAFGFYTEIRDSAGGACRNCRAYDNGPLVTHPVRGRSTIPATIFWRSLRFFISSVQLFLHIFPST